MPDPTPPSGQYGELRRKFATALMPNAKQPYDPDSFYWSAAEGIIRAVAPTYEAELEAKDRERREAIGALVDAHNKYFERAEHRQQEQAAEIERLQGLMLHQTQLNTDTIKERMAAEQREAEARSLLNMAQGLIPTRYPAAIQQIKDFLESKP